MIKQMNSNEIFQTKIIKSEENFEKEQTPKVRLMITRHAERIPSGELSPKGIKNSKKKGQRMRNNTEVLKGYVSDEKSNRTFDTSEFISNESEIKSSLTNETYATRKVSDIQYDILKPDLSHCLIEARNLIEEATLKELNFSTEKDEDGKFKINIGKLPKKEQIKIAPIRQKNQKLGMRFILGKEEVIHRLAMGLAHQ
ncbi:histidine phosphatase family protein [Candidatus Parcubacteria bacterium]|nr:histidine phosphatase family protein [Candidatus Parcubacteria bacterium]